MLYDHRTILSGQPEALPAGRETVLSFRGKAALELPPERCRYKLRLRGEAGVHPGWMWEGGYPLLYRDIDDALCTDVTRQAQFSLRLRMAGESYPRRAYCKLCCPLRLSPQFPVPGGGLGSWLFSIWAKAEDLTWTEEGGAGVSFSVWNRREGLDPRDINRPPEETHTLSLRPGSYDWEEFGLALTVTEETAVILVTVFAEHAGGTVWLESPELSDREGRQILPQFTLSNQYHPHMNWLGENLSHKEWTDLQVTVNGQALPRARLFQRCHSGSENEIPLPDGCILPGENRIVLRNVNDYLCPHPYRLMRAELLYEEIRPVRILFAPRVAAAGAVTALLVETAEQNADLRVEAAGDAVVLETLPRAGMQVVRLRAGESGPGFSVTVSAGGESETVRVERIVAHGADNVLTGTSDSIYIPQDDPALMREFLVWYLSNRIGNFITFRPVYRWTGTRELNPALWTEIRALCEALELPYCHIIDGRELPGLNANPPLALLEGPQFVGCQGHERDGALNYWRQRPTTEPYLLFHELTLQNFRHPDYCYSDPILYTDHGTFLYFDPVSPRDMREAAEQFVQKSAHSLAGIKRHTGPSVLFRYFFQGGLEVGGAELMYGPQEVILAALRGASRCYGRREMAGHLAVQWSTTPHDTPERYRRYQLALYVSWLQGVHHINTEEGLYRMEEDFSILDRFDGACREHLRVQQEFAHFVQTHTRRGSLVTPIALLHGRYDGWSCFGRGPVWGHYGEAWKFSAPEESWDLIKVFYPDSVLDALYEHPCPNRPVGFYSRTPYGEADILPVEADEELLAAYPFLAFLGYHGALPEDTAKLAAYVRGGGTLLLSWAHLNTALDRQALLYGAPLLPDTSELTGVLPTGFTCGDGPRIGLLPELPETEVLERTEGGLPLVFCRRLGKGRLYLVNTAEYPAHPGIRPVYERYLRLLAGEAAARESARGYLAGADTVQSAAYDRDDGLRTIYAIHTGWWQTDGRPAEAVLQLAGRETCLKIPQGVISCVTVDGDCAVMTSDNDTEVLTLDRKETGLRLRVQGGGRAGLRLLLPSGCHPEGCVQEREGVWRLELELDGVCECTIAL